MSSEVAFPDEAFKIVRRHLRGQSEVTKREEVRAYVEVIGYVAEQYIESAAPGVPQDEPEPQDGPDGDEGAPDQPDEQQEAVSRHPKVPSHEALSGLFGIMAGFENKTGAVKPVAWKPILRKLLRVLTDLIQE